MSSMPAHPVQAAILERSRAGSRPGRRADALRVGLVVEGGVMRGVVSAGMLLGLEALGLRDAFDAVYGSSAGAVNAAYFLSGQGREGIPLYYDYVNSRAFVDPLRALRHEPVVDLDFVYSHVVTEVLPLDWQAVAACGIRLVVSAARADPPATPSRLPIAYLSDFSSQDDLLGCLRASAQFPLLAGGPFGHRGCRFTDAGIAEPIPVAAALADGCTHVLVLRTLAERARPRHLYALERCLEEAVARPLSPILADLVHQRRLTYDAECSLLKRKQSIGTGPPFISTITLPDASPRVHLLEMRRAVLIAAARGGMAATLRAFVEADDGTIERTVLAWVPSVPSGLGASGREQGRAVPLTL